VCAPDLERVEAEDRPPTTDLVATLKASLGRKALAKATPRKSEQEKAAPAKRPGRGGGAALLSAQSDIARNPGETGSWWPVGRLRNKRFQGRSTPGPGLRKSRPT